LVSPEYSARKHQTPDAVGRNVVELAVELVGDAALSCIGPPTG
jgi:hypothetical protein